MEKTLTLFLLIMILTLNACATSNPTLTTESATFVETQMPIAVSPTEINPSTQVSSQNTYNNSKYGYSLNYPNTYNVAVVSDEYVEIGGKITVEVMNIDPTAPRGDGAVVENSSDIQFSGYPAKLLTGYIGSVGGYMPQQFKKIVVERNSNYFVVTLYALGLHVIVSDISQIAQLTPEDVSLFDNIAASMQIP